MDPLRGTNFTQTPVSIGKATEGASKGTNITGLSDDLQKINDGLNNQTQSFALLVDQLQNYLIDDPNKALEMQGKLEKLMLQVESQSTAMKVVFDTVKELESKIPPAMR